MKTNSLAAWMLAVRPYSLGNAVILILVGSALAWTDGSFHWLPALLCLVFAVLMQCTANLVNDLWDFLKGADQPDRLGPDRAFAKGYITPRAMKAGIAAFTVASCAAGIGILVWALRHDMLAWGGWELVAVGAACILFAYFYTAGPWPLAYHGLGDVAVIPASSSPTSTPRGRGRSPITDWATWPSSSSSGSSPWASPTTSRPERGHGRQPSRR